MSVASFSDLEAVAEARTAVEAAHRAWQEFRAWSAEDVDRVVEAMSRAVAPEAGRLAELAAEETGYGNVEDKRLKNLFNSIAVADWLRNVRTLGVLWRDEVTKVVAVGEPMGVVAALIPVTSPTAMVIFKTLSALKAGNAIVHAPHPRGRVCGAETARILAAAAVEAGAPSGLVQCLRGGRLEGTQELMHHDRTAVVLATGGADMVRIAYSSGKPTLAVGPGNVPVYVDRSKAGELDEVVEMILTSRSLDNGTACLSEQAVLADRPIAERLRQAMRQHGAYFCSAREARALGAVIFRPGGGHRVANVGQSAARLAELGGFTVPPRTRVLVAECEQIGPEEPLSAEKLDPALAFYEVDGVEGGIERAGEVLRFGGEGHTAAIHSAVPATVSRYSALPAGRILVNTPCLHGGMGFSCDIDPSFMLGTGTSSGSIVSDNVTALHLINIKRIAYESRPWRSLADLEGAH